MLWQTKENENKSRIRLRLGLIGMMIAFLAQCTQLGLVSDDDDDNAEALLSALFLTQCSIGGVSFTNSGASCGLNNASGSGVLTAVGTRSDFLSVQLSFQLADSSSSIQLVGGGTGDIVSNSTTSNYINIANGATTIQPNGSASTGGAGTGANTWCMEMHFEENPDHIILDQTACVAKSTSGVTLDEETNSRDTSGGNWGIVLNNASITGLNFNTSETFSD